jgi:polysaccharide export outer membrane protein
MKTLLVLLGLLALLAPASYSQATLRKGDSFKLVLSGMPAETAQEWMLDYTVGDDGRVKIPYIGDVNANATSINDFCRNIERRLVAEKIFTHPTAVLILQPQSRFVTVGGEVRSPSTVPWTPDMTLSQAIKRVGGVGEWGKLTKIKVTREGKSQIFNLKKADKDPEQNPKLLPGDEIEVL